MRFHLGSLGSRRRARIEQRQCACASGRGVVGRGGETGALTALLFELTGRHLLRRRHDINGSVWAAAVTWVSALLRPLIWGTLVLGCEDQTRTIWGGCHSPSSPSLAALE